MKKKFDGPSLLLLNNCGGHIPRTALPGVCLELFPPYTSATYQPLDQGLISQAKFGIALCCCVRCAIIWKINGLESMDSEKTLEKAHRD